MVNVDKVLKLEIRGFWNLEDHGQKEDGTPNVRRKSGYVIRLVRDNTYILFEETLSRERVPIDPTQYLVRRISTILETHLKGIDPE